MREVSDIGEIPAVVNPERRESCRLDLERFLVTYFPHSTGLTSFSADHRRVLRRMQGVCINGGRQCNVVYRGFAKTTCSENTAIWATAYGHRKFVPIFGGDAGAAERIIDSIKTELETNDMLMEDFPEVCHAIRSLEGKPQRQHSQHCCGKRTHIEFTADTVVLPTIEGSAASGAILTAHGLTAASRGLKHKRSDGSNARPDFVIIDDPQTDESARSPSQVSKRLGLIKKNILKMAGHRTRLAVVLNGTIIEPDDLVDQLSDYKRNPSWEAERIPMIRKWADAHDTLWLLEYAKLRRTYDPDDPGDKERAEAEANAFYAARREAMDAGCEVSWESCYDPDTELSAIQHAYNMLIDDGPDVFASECQNAPRRIDEHEGMVELKQHAVESRTNGLPRGVVPQAATHLVAHIDVQHSLLFYTVLACDNDLSGDVVDYRTFPEQPMPYFMLREARRKLADAYPKAGAEAVVEQGLTDLLNDLFSRDWKREDGALQALELCLIDWSDGTMADVVARVCRTHRFKALIMPAAGKGIGPGDPPMMGYKVREGEELGHHWLKTRNAKYAVRSVTADTNYWKSRLADALGCLPTMRGAIRLYGDEKSDHRMFADHCGSERGEKLTHERTKREGYVWKKKPNRENHYFDNLYNCLVAASMRGCGKDATMPKRERKPLSQIMGSKK